MPWKRWNWLDNGLMPLLLATLRACWLWPWLVLASAWLAPSFAGVPLRLPAIILLPVVSFGLSRWLGATVERHSPSASISSSSAPPAWARLLMAALGLVTIALLLWWNYYRATMALFEPQWLVDLGYSLIRWENELPPQFLTLLAVAYLWLRGMLDAAKQLTHDDVWSTFVSGVLAWTLYLLAIAAGGAALDPYATTLLLGFFALGMSGLAFTSLKITTGLDRALAVGRNQDSKAPQLNRYWLLSVVTVIAVLIGLGLLIGAVVAPDMLARLLGLLNSAVGFVGRILGQILIAVGYVLFMIAYFIATLLRPLIQRLLDLLAGERETPEFLGGEPLPTPEATPLVAEEVPEEYRWIGLAIFIVVMLVIFALALRRLRAAQSEEADEVRESILTADLLQSQLGSLFAGLMNRLRTAGKQISPYLSLEGEADARRRIRQIYQDLLAAATVAGLPRAQDQTPAEYASELGATYALDPDDLNAVTSAYVHARYAEDLPALEATTRMADAWATIRPEISGDTQADGDDDEESIPAA